MLFRSEIETPYLLFDENEDFVYLSEDHPEVVGVTEFIAEFVTVMNTMDYRTIKTDKAYPYLTQTLLEFTKEQKTWELLFNNLKEVEVVSEIKSIEIETAVFENDLTEVYVLYVSTLNILEANEEKLAEANMFLGENYERAGLHLKSENGQWKVNGFGKLD